jgi:hypothetical protein
VAEYIIREILNDDLEFKNLIYKQVFEDYTAHFFKGEFPDNKYFINHKDENVRTMAAHIFSEGYKPSAIWTKGGKKLETPEMTLKTDVPRSISNYKISILKQALDEKFELLNKSKEDIELTEQLQKQIQILSATKTKLFDETNRVVK